MQFPVSRVRSWQSTWKGDINACEHAPTVLISLQINPISFPLSLWFWCNGTCTLRQIYAESFCLWSLFVSLFLFFLVLCTLTLIKGEMWIDLYRKRSTIIFYEIKKKYFLCGLLTINVYDFSRQNKSHQHHSHKLVYNRGDIFTSHQLI